MLFVWKWTNNDLLRMLSISYELSRECSFLGMYLFLSMISSRKLLVFDISGRQKKKTLFSKCFLICSSLKILLAMRMVQSGCFGEALSLHKEIWSGAQKMEKRNYTQRTSKFIWMGFAKCFSRCEFKFMENIIKQVLEEANQTPLDVAWKTRSYQWHGWYIWHWWNRKNNFDKRDYNQIF